MDWHDGTAARTIWGEARGEGAMGMAAVGHVLLNRLATGRWGKTLSDVCLRPYQFSCWNIGDPNRALVLELGDVELAAEFAALEEAGAEVDITGGATHYYAAGTQTPNWVEGADFTVQIGRHRFYTNVR